MSRGASPRAEISRRAAPAVRKLLGCGALLLAACLAQWIVRLAWADRLSRRASLADRQRAVKLWPAATLYQRLADQREQAGQNPLPDLERAASLDPANADRQMRLGVQAELAGDLDLAEGSLLAAADHSKLYQPRYLLAHYYFRRRNADGFWRWWSEALYAAYGDVAPLLDLAWRERPDGDWFAEYGNAQAPTVARQFLSFLVERGQTAAAGRMAVSLAGRGSIADLPPILGYCNLALSQGITQGPVNAWNLLCDRRLLSYSRLDPPHGVSLTNGHFAHQPLSSGLDWHFEPVPGVTAGRDPNGLRLNFSGTQPERCLIAWQYLPVVRGAAYLVEIDVRPDANGLEWLVLDPLNHELHRKPSPTFRASADVLRLALFYQRPIGSPRFEGTMQLVEVRLKMVP